MRKKILFSVVLFSLVIALTGCETLTALGVLLKDRATTAVSETKESIDNLKKQINDTKKSIDQKVEDIETAVDEVKEAKKELGEAVDAVKKVTD